MYSRLTLKIYALIKSGVIKSRKDFWDNFSDIKTVETYRIDFLSYSNEVDKSGLSLICIFDKEFPKVDFSIKQSEKPFFFAYKGDLNILNNISQNVAVIGALEPTEDIMAREVCLVEELLKQDFSIISGLARGVDTIAHETCLKLRGKTVAFLPTTLCNIYPKENERIAELMAKNYGLVISEYITEAENKYERIKRFIERDRLQAMFSENVVLVASYRHGYGDSGARHAMQKASKYRRQRWVMINIETDDLPIFGLNFEELERGAKIITPKAIKGMKDDSFC